MIILFGVIMGFPLTDFLTYGEDGQPIFDATFTDGRKATSYQDYLRVLDEVTQICGNEDDAPLSKAYVQKLAKILLQKYQEHLRDTQNDWYGKNNPKLYTVAKQLEAFAFLTGEQEAIRAVLEEFPLLNSIKCHYEDYQGDNFLNKVDPLKFKNFDRDLLTLQMMIRVLDPRYINQRDDQVCGVNAFVHNMALFNPLKYVKITAELAATGVCDLKEFAGKEGVLRIEVTQAVANKKSSAGDTLHDVDHIILNGIRSSENTTVGYSAEGAELAKQLFGVTTHHEVNRWMKQAGYHHVQNIPIDDKERIKQLQLLIQDGYMVGFAGTGSLAAYILNPEDGAPKDQNAVQRFMDGHFFIVRNIEFDEENDKVNIRIMTWGEEKSASIPLDVWKKNIGLVGTAVVGQDPYMSFMFRAKARVIDDIQRSTYCSPEAYCLYVRNILEDTPGYEHINKLVDEAFKHKNGITWLQAAKEIQDAIEALPREKASMVPSKISIIPVVTPEVKAEFDRIHLISERKEKIEALEKLVAQDNIEVQRQLIPLYAQEGQWEKVRELFTNIKSYSRTDQEIMLECLEQGCDLVRCIKPVVVTVPDDINELIDENKKININAKDLIRSLSEITGLPKGGHFTYGLRGRLLEVINSRLREEGREVEHLHDVTLYKKDVYHFIELLDKEIQCMDPSHKIMNKEQRTKFGTALIDKVKAKEQPNAQVDAQLEANLSYKPNKTLNKIREFFLKVASVFDKNIITKGVEKTKAFKENLDVIKEGDLEQQDAIALQRSTNMST